MPHLCKYMFISNIFPCDLDVYDTMSVQVHVHFKASSPVIHMVYDCTFVQVQVHFKHPPPPPPPPPGDLEGLWLHICASTCPFLTPSPMIKMVYDCTFVQVQVHFKHLPPWSRWFMIAHLCKYVSISDTFLVIKMIHYSTVMESQILVDWA